MIQMRVGQDDGVDACRLNRQRYPVQLAKVLQSLEQTAIDQDARAAMREQMLRPGDGACTAE